VKQTLVNYYNLPDHSLPCTEPPPIDGSRAVGFFQFGNGNVCYGSSRAGVVSSPAESANCPADLRVRREGSALQLPFDFDEVIDNLRMERYKSALPSVRQTLVGSEFVRALYYFFRGCLPPSIRRQLHRAYFHDLERLQFPSWPVDFTVDGLHESYLRLLMQVGGLQKLPFIWFWPDGAPNCLIMTHDVETSAGRDFSSQLMDIDDSFGIKASFQVIPEKRYSVPKSYLNEIRTRGFELNVHDLSHDGHLYRDRSEFLRRATRINSYVREYQARGFRAGAMYRNLEWYDVFEFSYDMSVPNVAHLEPLRGGCCTVMPYFVGKIVELPLTTAQDYSLFHILNDYSIELWKQQKALIRGRNGLISFLTHPDYLIERRARNVYESLLDHLAQMIAREQVWAALPGDVDLWWRARSQMKLVSRRNEWEIVGPEKERARLAFAVLDGDRLVYQLAEESSPRRAPQ
jgi:hypothetical protein